MATSTRPSTRPSTRSRARDADAPEVHAHVQHLLAEVAAVPEDLRARVVSALVEALGERSSAVPEATPARRTAQPKRRAPRGEAAHLESRLSTLADPSDPLQAWQAFGDAEQLLAVLSAEPQGALEAMLHHPAMPPGAAPRGRGSAALARAIVRRLVAAQANP